MEHPITPHSVIEESESYPPQFTKPLFKLDMNSPAKKVTVIEVKKETEKYYDSLSSQCVEKLIDVKSDCELKAELYGDSSTKEWKLTELNVKEENSFCHHVPLRAKVEISTDQDHSEGQSYSSLQSVKKEVVEEDHENHSGSSVECWDKRMVLGQEFYDAFLAVKKEKLGSEFTCYDYPISKLKTNKDSLDGKVIEEPKFENENVTELQEIKTELDEAEMLDSDKNVLDNENNKLLLGNGFIQAFLAVKKEKLSANLAFNNENHVGHGVDEDNPPLISIYSPEDGVDSTFKNGLDETTGFSANSTVLQTMATASPTVTLPTDETNLAVKRQG